MENFFAKLDNNQNFTNQFNSNTHPIYSTSLSLTSFNTTWSNLSQSSGFESQPESIDLVLDYENNNQNYTIQTNDPSSKLNHLSQSLDSYMDSADVFGTEIELGNSQSTSNINLWQFLLELLEDKRCRNLIRWISNSSEPFSTIQLKTSEKSYHDNEFIILDPIEVSRRWALRRNKPCTMTYNKFNRILRYYNKKKVLQKINGKNNTYIFQINIQPYLNELRLTKLNQEQVVHSFHFS